MNQHIYHKKKLTKRNIACWNFAAAGRTSEENEPVSERIGRQGRSQPQQISISAALMASGHLYSGSILDVGDASHTALHVPLIEMHDDSLHMIDLVHDISRR